MWSVKSEFARGAKMWRCGACLLALASGMLTSASCRRPSSQSSASPVRPTESRSTVARGISPPDLSQCTRIEVEYDPSTLEHFFPNYERHSVLSPEEIAYVRSLKTVIEDPKIIKAIAREVCAGQHISIRKGAITFKAFTRFVCYHEGGDSTLLTILPDTIGIAGHWFKYEDGLRSTRYVPPQIKSLLARERCADNMVHLYDYLRLRYWDGRPFPSPGEWCDVIVEA